MPAGRQSKSMGSAKTEAGTLRHRGRAPTRRLPLTGVLGLLPACNWIFSYASPPPAIDVQETRAVDGPTPTTDPGRSLELAAAVDRAPHLESSTPLDGNAGLDTPGDGPRADVGSVGGCAPGNEAVIVDQNLVFCTAPTPLYSQCTAAMACDGAAGWRLCPAPSYLQRFAVAHPPVPQAWIAGCVRDGGQTMSPTSTVCSSCTSATTTAIEVAWSCTTHLAAAITAAREAGLVSESQCLRVGANAVATAGYWLPQWAGALKSAAACCR